MVHKLEMRVMVLHRTEPNAVPAGPLKRLLDPAQPFQREDVLWALHDLQRKAAEGAPEWSGLDRPQLLAFFSSFADMALLLLRRQTPGTPEADRFRAMLEALYPNARV